MSIASRRTRQTHQPTFAELFAPKLITVLREGYDLADFRADVISGLTVAIVALPLSMAIAIASGVTPDRGLYTAVVGGFIVSLLGGSRFQIGGPAGAFIVLVALTAERQGVDGVILATAMAGVFLIAAGLLRLGTYIKFIPYPVTVGFTAGIAVIIFASQIKDLFGITLTVREPGRISSEAGSAGGRTAYRQCLGHRRGRCQHRHHCGPAQAAAALARYSDRGRRLRRSRHGRCRCRWKPSAPASAAFPGNCHGRHGRCSHWRKRGRFCLMRSRSRCSARSNPCCRPWWPTA